MPSACLGRHDHAVDVAHVQAFAIAVVLLFAPSGASETCTATSGEPPVCTQVNTSMLSHEGLWVLLPLVLPAIAYLVPVKLRGNLAAWLTAVALLVFCPGYIATDNTQALRDDEGRANAILDRIPAGRIRSMHSTSKTT